MRSAGTVLFRKSDHGKAVSRLHCSSSIIGVPETQKGKAYV